jgi:hemerythrin-like domain-containing protein
MSTNSLRRDHDLIEKVIKSMETTIQLLNDGKKIPEFILSPVIDFSKNFTDVCHHSKEENSLFPALEQAGMPVSGIGTSRNATEYGTNCDDVNGS